MRSISRKKLLLFGFLAVLMLAIPLTVYLVQQQQETRSGAQAATNLQLCPPDETNCPPLQPPFTNKFTQTVRKGDEVQVEVKINPDINAVTWIKFLVKYDPQVLSLKTDDGGEIIAFEQNASSQFIIDPNIPPVYDPDLGTISVEMAINALNPGITGGVQTLGTLNFVAEEVTVTEADPAAFTSLSFDMTAGNTDARSSLESEPKEPVIANAIGTDVIIEASEDVEPTAESTEAPTAEPTEGDGGNEEGGDTNQAPVCESFTVDETEGTAPLSITFTTEGFDPDGIVSKITFNFGDGPAQDLTETGGIGEEASVSAQIGHTYSTDGEFTATATFIDDNNATSDPNFCSETISVGGGGAIATATPEPTLPATGPDKTVVGVGLLGAILTVLGFVIFFAL